MKKSIIHDEYENQNRPLWKIYQPSTYFYKHGFVSLFYKQLYLDIAVYKVPFAKNTRVKIKSFGDDFFFVHANLKGYLSEYYGPGFMQIDIGNDGGYPQR